jgi:hypothetical protein
LGIDPHPLPDLPDAAFQQIAHPDVAGDLLHVRQLAFVDERRVTGDDDGPMDLRQFGRAVFGQTIDEMFLFRVAPEIGKRRRAQLKGRLRLSDLSERRSARLVLDWAARH